MSTSDHDHELFGELRSLLHRTHKDEHWAKDLLELLKLAHEELGEQVSCVNYFCRWTTITLAGRSG
ncbi:MAG: hypothetical protein AAGI01_18235 [Myxococcota bacterium]